MTKQEHMLMDARADMIMKPKKLNQSKWKVNDVVEEDVDAVQTMTWSRSMM